MGRRPARCRVLLAKLNRAGQLPDIAADIAAGVADAIHAPVARLLEEAAVDGSLRRVADPAQTGAGVFGAVTITALQSLVLDAESQAEAVTTAVFEVPITTVTAAAHDASRCPPTCLDIVSKQRW